jgi:hypothetical protein
VLVASRLSPWRGRPFFLDEGWRAYAISTGNVWHGTTQTDTPLALGWMLSAKAWAAAFGNRENVLRFEPLLLLPVLAVLTFLLVRLAAPVVLAAIAGAGVVAQTTVVNYATMFKQYIGEATVTVAIMLLWLVVVSPRRSRGRRITAAVCIGLLSLASTPALFLVGVLVAAWALPTVLPGSRRRSAQVESTRPVVALSTVALLPGLLHAGIFLRRQEAGLASNAVMGAAWDRFYPPNGIRHLPGWLLEMAQGWIPGAVTSAIPVPLDAGPTPSPVHGVAAVLVTVGMLTALAFGMLAARRSAVARWVAVAYFGTQVALLCLAAAHVWPTGFNRTNLFLLPLFVALLAIGTGHLLRELLRHARSRPTSFFKLGAAVASLVVIAGAGVVAATTFADGQRAVRERLDAELHGYPSVGGGTPAAVRAIKEWCHPDDVVIVASQARQFAYYYFDWDDPTMSQPTAPSRNVLLGGFDNPATASFLRHHPHASRVCVLEAFGVSGELHDRQMARLASAGFSRFAATAEGRLARARRAHHRDSSHRAIGHDHTLPGRGASRNT